MSVGRRELLHSGKVAAAASPATPPRATTRPPGAGAESASTCGGKPLGPPIVSVHRLCKSYQLADRADLVRALDDVSLAGGAEFDPIRQGEFLMIRGPSGGGKTTLLNIIGAIDLPTSGYIELLGKRVDASSADVFLSDLRLNTIGFVFQTFNLIATMSAFENVELPMTLAGVPRGERRKRSLHLLHLVGLRDRVNHLPCEMSGGEQQRTTIARALANNPSVLLLDEPTGDLDTVNTVDIMNLLLDLNIQSGVTCIMVTHNADVEPYADRILYVRDGAINQQVYNERQSRINLSSYLEHLQRNSSAAAQTQGHDAAAALSHSPLSTSPVVKTPVKGGTTPF